MLPVRFVGLLLSFFALAAAAEEVERVLALVNGVPILSSDVQLARLAALVPRQPQEEEAAYRVAVLEALIALELRYQDLVQAHWQERLAVDMERAWAKVLGAAGGEVALREKLAEEGLAWASLEQLVRRAALVEAYVDRRFAHSLRVGEEELEQAYQHDFLPHWPASQGPPPALAAVRDVLAQLLNERKLAAQVDAWTQELARRGEVVRYWR